MKLIYMIMILFSMINLKILKMSHPLMITIFLVIQTLMITMIIGLTSQTFWMSYIMFLIFIGGLLVLFIYISSLIPNKILNFKKINIMTIITFLIFIFFIIPSFDTMINMETMKMFNFFLMMNYENNLFLSNFYNQNEMYFFILMMMYLLMSLIIAVKITNLNHNPMRIKN
uniref:NADH-ubiquinone oxidoreductase chain 6 n=1 Tax=Brachycentrus kozlovi TaxID=2566358 RepID=A0A9E8LNQ2_9NEOP|nr:NADH dehydrogenase subunit 6 [Brachycentrus kozlovi]UZZ43815.1 NADH dehydrogenase subunit 6 [Brachycentrus kozlovi]